MRRWAGPIAVVALGLAVSACQERGRGADAPDAAARLIPRADIFGDPAFAAAAINPQGDRIAYLASANGVQHVFVAPIEAVARARAVTADAPRGVRDFLWAETGRHILYLRDDAGDENWRLNVVGVDTGEQRELTPQGAQAEIVGYSPAEPNIVIVALNDRDRAWRDLYRIDILTGERTLLVRNTRRFAEFYVDRSNRVRLALQTTSEGGAELWSRDAAGAWRRLLQIPFEDAASSRFLTFESDSRHFLMLDSTGRDRAGLVRVDAATGEKTLLGESQRADIVDVWLNPLTRAPQAFVAEYLRREWRPVDPAALADIDFLDAQLAGEPRVLSRTRDDRAWIVQEEGPTTPTRTWLYRRGPDAPPRLTLLFRNRPALESRTLAPMIPVEIQARDDLTLVSYLTLPLGADANDDSRPEAPLPLVLAVHDGPWARDSYGLNPTHQWLANRGYAVLSVNFRGSAGLGKAFLNAGNREWGGQVREDLLDAVQWAVDEGIARADRVAIMGSSFGGYAALAGLAFTPDRYACGVSLSGPSNLAGFVESTPPAWEAHRAELYERVGDPRDAAEAQRLRDQSPLFRAARMRGPLLIAQGARDPRVPRADADQIAAALSVRGNQSVYLLYPDEAHGLSRTPNRLSFYAVAENFLARCLGGLAQPLSDRDFAGASARTLAGIDYLPGLRERAPPPRRRSVRANEEGGLSLRPSVNFPEEEGLPDRDLPVVTAPQGAAQEPKAANED
ncbi:MAG: prolyl oligopeptidase family serine peptidase [Hyphomonadaceae bacterium]